MISPNQDPSLAHTCKVPFVVYGDTFTGSGDQDVDFWAALFLSTTDGTFYYFSFIRLSKVL